jgi:hypothetical protein
MVVRFKLTPSTLNRRTTHTAVIGFLGVLFLSLYNFLVSTRNLVPYLLSDNSNDLDNVERRIEYSSRRLAPCLFNSNVVCRFDMIGRFLEDDPTIPNVVHRHIQAVPSYRRTPRAMANNRTYIVRGLTSFPDDATNKDATNATLNEYNPTILPLYKNGPNGTIISDFDQKLLDELTGRYHPDFSDAEADQVQYLAVTRSSNHYPYCIPGGFRKFVDKGYNWVNYAGLALLDSNLQPVDGADVLIDIEKYYFMKRDTRLLQDFTVFAARTTRSNRKKDHLFLMTNGMYVLPIAIRRVPPGIETDESDWETKIKRSRIPQDTMYGTGLQVRMTHQGDHANFNVRDKSIRIAGGKNMHMFESINGTTYIELWPHSNHTVKAVNFFLDSFTSFEDYDWYLQKQIATPDLRGGPSFVSMPPGGLSWKKDLNRGTGCCADFALPDGRPVKLGIAHSVAIGLSYLHRFYAFLPEEPFPVIAISGLFCLGHMTIEDRDITHHWISGQDNAFKPRQASIGGQGYDCPKVTFATGITNMIGHGDNYIIISYGIDDCYSRSIIVHKKKIEMLMFQDFLNTTQEGNIE